MISVVIPFYNARQYVEEAVKSALVHHIVSEVVLIYDGCSHFGFQDLEELFSEDVKVRVIHHDNFENRGAGASRNLGIQVSSSPWIAFLDADDYFLSNRFDYFNKYLAKNVEFDGIYEAAVYEKSVKMRTVLKSLDPSDLLHFLIRGTFGHFCTDGLIVKREVCFRAGLFNEELWLHQDSEFWLRLAYYGNLIAGDISNPVSVIRKHETNRIWSGTSNSSRFKQWMVTWLWAWNTPIGLINKILILRKLFRYKLSSLIN